MKKYIASVAILVASLASAGEAMVEKVVPESYVSKAWTVKTATNVEMRVTFWRPDVFRIEAGVLVADTNVTVKTEISATGQYVTTTNAACYADYKDPKNDPAKAQMLVDGAAEDMTRVRFEDGEKTYVWSTSAITLKLDKASGTFACWLATGEKVWQQSRPLDFIKSVSEDNTDDTILRLETSPKVCYFGGGQQNGDVNHTGRRIDIIADCKWDEGGHPNPAPWMMARVDKGVYYGIFRHSFAAGAYDFTGKKEISMTQFEYRFDAFFFAGTSFNQVLDRYTELTGRPNFIPVWALELGDADAWMTRDKDTREPKQNEDRSYVETTTDVVARNAEKYRADDMPCGWLLVNDGYGCKYMQLGWTVRALESLGFRTGLWTEGALDRIGWEIGKAGTRIQKIDVAWSGPAYQHGLQCNKTAYDGFIDNSNARAFIWTCQGWAGTQRYGVCWTGDQYGNLDLVRYHIPTITGSGMSGQAYATTDIDGIFGGSNESFVRDLEFKCFTPALYVMNGWSDVNKAPWSYPEPYKSIIRDWLKWKLRITPYMYTTCREAWLTGAPIVRPLAWNYPDDEVALSDKVKYQMMLGRDFLVAPMFDSEELTSGWYLRGIYLPAGTWYDYNDGRRVKGGVTLAAYPTTLATLPVFVRGGAIIPMYPETQYSDQKVKDTVTFDIWPDGDSEYSMYEDDGETRDYEKGEWTTQTVKVSAPKAELAGDVKVEILPVSGKGYRGQPVERAYELWVRTAANPTQILIGGEELLAIAETNADKVARIYANSRQCWYYDPADKGGTVKIKLAKRCVKSACEVVVCVPPAQKGASADYPKPPREVVKRTSEKASEQTKFVAKMNSPDLYLHPGKEYKIELDGTWKRVKGSVVCSKDTDPGAVLTFRLTTDTGKVIFERVGQKGNDAPQLVAVNIPVDAKELTFSVVRDGGEGLPALGVWKDIKLAK